MTTIMKPPLAHHPWVAHSARIVDIRSEVPHVSTYDLVFDNDDVAAAYRFKPGQFNMLYLPGYGESAISISSDPGRQDLLSHTVRVAGNVTQALARKRIGDHVALRGPFGSHWPVESCCGQDVVLACGGIGLAPLRPAIYHILSHRGDYGRVILLYGARTPNDLLYTSEYAAWRDQRLEAHYPTENSASLCRGRRRQTPRRPPPPIRARSAVGGRPIGSKRQLRTSSRGSRDGSPQAEQIDRSSA